MSSLPAYQLPKSMKGHGVTPLCSVESVLNHEDMKLKNRHWYVPFFCIERPGVLFCFLIIFFYLNNPRYNLGPKYYRAEFELRVLIGPADLKFQMWGRNGRLSKDHEEIQVLWNPTDQATVLDITDDIYNK
jgi:hypothetical protein